MRILTQGFQGWARHALTRRAAGSGTAAETQDGDSSCSVADWGENGVMPP